MTTTPGAEDTSRRSAEGWESFDFVARVMLTDRRGLQEECCVLGTPCLTLRENAERPVTLAEHGGASVLVGTDVTRLRAEYRRAVSFPRRPARPELWDGGIFRDKSH